MRIESTDHATACYECDGELLRDPPREVRLCSTVQRVSHEFSWYVQDGSTSYHFRAADHASVAAWLAANGYTARDTLPPGCFEFWHRSVETDRAVNNALPTIC